MGKLTNAQMKFLRGFDQFGSRYSGHGEGAVARSCVRAGLVRQHININNGYKQYSLTEAGRALLSKGSEQSTGQGKGEEG